jgi:hypothetical protein
VEQDDENERGKSDSADADVDSKDSAEHERSAITLGFVSINKFIVN